MQIGKLRVVDLREVWPNEAQAFTPWLEANPNELGDVLGLDLELTKEKAVGKFSLDLFGRDLRSERVVIVENQLGVSDHTHLGQLLTYAGGLEPAIVVWIAKEIREEHRAALEWLNRHTPSEIMFFGIEVKAVRIDDSPAAPLLDIIVQPNEWAKTFAESSNLAGLSDRRTRFGKFWEELLEELAKQHPELQNRSAQPQSWLPTSTGVAFVNLNLAFTGKGLSAEYYFESPDAELNRARFESVLALKHEVESNVGRALDWQPLEGKKACRIANYGLKGADVMEEKEWPTYKNWFLESYSAMKKANNENFRRALKSSREVNK